MWLYVQSLCAPGSEASTSDCGNSLGRSATSSATDLRLDASCPRCAEESSTMHQCGTTFERSTQPLGVEKPSSCAPVSPARLTPPRAEAGASRPTCGPTCSPESTNSQRRSCSSRTSSAGRSNVRPASYENADTARRSSRTTPPTWVPRIDESDGGFLPTLTTRANQHSPSMRKWPAYERLNRLFGGSPAPVEFWEWMFGYPIGHTDCERWATPSCLHRPRERSPS